FIPVEDDDDMWHIQSMYRREYRRLESFYTNHLFIRNYKQIIVSEKYFQPEIAECIYLEGDECVAILKTFWIRIIQRRWKKVVEERKRVLGERMKLSNIQHREMKGHWRDTCYHLPGLRGMLSSL
ncbi:MAG: hypothetical protein EBS86_11695, partial [Crocinitomicaceae bacterium]|nr:hypothetical protein [Crocinitomicaceae bacterium]